MATYNNRHWLLSHIRNSFISTDDTGMSENVMSAEDMPSHFLARIKKKSISESYENYMCYPGLDQSDDEDGFSVANSYDIQMNTDLSFHRQRSNTAHNLEKLKLARARASKIKSVKVDEKAIPPMDEHEKDMFLTKRPVKKMSPTANRRSKLSEALLLSPKQSQNKFIEYSRFDGSAQTTGPTRTMHIFLTMLPEHQRNYPMAVCVSMTAKVQDFIGLICYKVSLAYPQVPLKTARDYGLFICEDDGELEPDFPPLDVREPCSKFRFSHLALVERRTPFALTLPQLGPGMPNPISAVFDYPRTLSMTSEMESIRHQAIIKNENTRRLDLQQQQTRDLATMEYHASAMEAHFYRSFRVNMLVMSSFYKVEIQLGVSGEKIEIDPVQQKHNRFWPSKIKAVTHKITSIAACDLVEVKASRAVFRIIYMPDKNAAYSSLLSSSFDNNRSRESAALPTVGTSAGSESEYRFATAGSTGKGSNATSPTFKHYSFETDLNTAQEIVDKVKNVLDVRTSLARKEFVIYKVNKSRRKNRPKTNI